MRFERNHAAVIVNQWLPAAHQGDAVGDNARRLRDIMRGREIESHIYALSIDDNLTGDIRHFDHKDSKLGDVTILHFAVPSPMTNAFASLPRGRVLQYHNVTPSHFFAPYDADIFKLADLGRTELKSLIGHTDVVLADSDFNRQELEQMGFTNPSVMPLVVRPERIKTAQNNVVLESALNDDLKNILFVGRIAPNKKIEDHLRLAEHYKRYVDTDYRFIFVGRTDAVPHYYDTIRALIAEYDMPPDRFIFTGPVSETELATYYKTASAYVSLSEHEGFCVPLIEAMAANVPVLAYGATAVPETLGGAGICFTPKDLEYAAELLGLLVYDDDLRLSILAGQQERLLDFGPASVETSVDNLLEACSLS